MDVLSLRRGALRFAPEALYALSGVLVLLGGYVLARHLPINRCYGHYFGYTSWLSNWDGQWYQYIVHRGYQYDGPGGYGPQVFFPLYPLLGRLLDTLSPLHGQLPLIVVSWAAAWAFCRVWIRYAAVRIELSSPNVPLWGLALVLLWPVSYFLRVAYTESLYIFLLTLFFYGCAKGWRIRYLVLVSGLLTATRPTAILVCAVLALHVFLRSRGQPMPRRIPLALAVGAVSAWGLYIYMAYLHYEFGASLLFLTKQQAWNYKMPASVFFLRWQEMLSLRPAWGFLFDGSLRDPTTYPWNLQNRGMWLASLALIAIGFSKKWLTTEELLFCSLTVLLIYFTHGPKNMESVGRYIYTLVPLYLVLARMLVSVPVALRVALLLVSATALTVQSAHFRLWHCVF